MNILSPPHWPRASGYSPGISARGRMVFVSGMVGWDAAQCFVAEDFVGQARQALENIVTVLATGGAKPEHLVRLTWYVTDRAAYRAAAKPLGAAYRAIIGDHYPAMSVVEVSALMEEAALLEIEATAVVPDEPPIF